MGIRLYLAQINPVVGDIKGNSDIIISHIRKARDKDADLAVFPELSLTGYPPEDLLLKNAFVRENMEYIETYMDDIGIIPQLGVTKEP